MQEWQFHAFFAEHGENCHGKRRSITDTLGQLQAYTSVTDAKEQLSGQKNGWKVGEIKMSATVYKWIIVYEGGYTEEKHGTCPADFDDDIVDVPIAIIREGSEWIDLRKQS